MAGSKNRVAESKDSVIEELYALRAGLSVISREADKIPTIEGEAKRGYVRIAKDATAGREKIVLHNSTSQDSSEQKTIKDFVHNVAIPDCSGRDYTREVEKKRAAQERSQLIAIAKKEECEEVAFAKWLTTKQCLDYYTEMSGRFRYSGSGCKKVAVVWTVLSLICVAAMIALGVLGVVADSGFFIGIAVPALAFAVCFLIACFYWVTYRKDAGKCEPIRKFIVWLDTAKERSEKIEDERRKELSEVKNKYHDMFHELEKRFSSVLDVRDWKYLDLIVYYFETGRAETMKEALQLVEREVQTQRIVGAIEAASEQICRTIKRTATAIINRLDVISAQLSVLIDQQEMQNALLAKANVTSERLMNDVMLIKTYSI